MTGSFDGLTELTGPIVRCLCVIRSQRLEECLTLSGRRLFETPALPLGRKPEDRTKRTAGITTQNQEITKARAGRTHPLVLVPFLGLLVPERALILRVRRKRKEQVVVMGPVQSAAEARLMRPRVREHGPDDAQSSEPNHSPPQARASTMVSGSQESRYHSLPCHARHPTRDTGGAPRPARGGGGAFYAPAFTSRLPPVFSSRRMDSITMCGSTPFDMS